MSFRVIGHANINFMINSFCVFINTIISVHDLNIESKAKIDN